MKSANLYDLPVFCLVETDIGSWTELMCCRCTISTIRCILSCRIRLLWQEGHRRSYLNIVLGPKCIVSFARIILG